MLMEIIYRKKLLKVKANVYLIIFLEIRLFIVHPEKIILIKKIQNLNHLILKKETFLN
jgi:hypothetical protein